jgi:hypothetical protein
MHEPPPTTPTSADDECVIPPPLPPEAMRLFVLGRNAHREREIAEHVESQAHGEEVMHVEKLKSEFVFGREHEVWDVWTDQERYWVITAPTNLYLQRLLPSADYALSLHVGLSARIASRQQHDTPVDEEERLRLAAPWRRWTQASEALEQAAEPEEFQAIGMRCRECLLELVRATAGDGMLRTAETSPQKGNFLGWSPIIARAVAGGKSSERVRSYLESVAASTWKLVNWLTHTSDATRPDAQLAIDATQQVLVAFGGALVRRERGQPERCPRCSSYRLSGQYRPELELDPPFVTVCEACGWIDTNRPAID